MKCLLSSLLIITFAAFAHSANEVQYINPSILGKPITGLNMEFNGLTNGVLPRAVRIEQRHGIITGIKIEYPSKVTLDDIRSSLNNKMGKVERDTKRADVFCWRDEASGFVIGVGKDENDLPSLTMTPINKKSN